MPPGESTGSLCRAVGRAEAADIASYGGFRAEPSGRSYEGKLFAGSFVDAVRFGRLIQQRLASREPFLLVEVELPESSVETLFQARMDRMTAFAVEPEQIAELNRLGKTTIHPKLYGWEEPG